MKTLNYHHAIRRLAAQALFGTDDRQFLLRARSPTATGPGRVYTITYSATDWAGNKTFSTAKVLVRR